MRINIKEGLGFKETVKPTLKFIAGMAAIASGACIISNFGTFKGKDFLTPGLTEKQIKKMDEHNEYHNRINQLNDFADSIAISFLGVSYASKIKNEASNETKSLLDVEVKDLPGKLAHKH